MSKIIVGSQQDIANKSNQTLAQTFLSCDLIAVVDISSSMDSRDASNGKSRWEVARKNLVSLQGRYQGKIALIEFALRANYNPSGDLSRPYGSTNLTEALEFVHVADDCGIKIIVVSDGEPDSKDAALAIATRFTQKIDAIYCGDERDLSGGRKFLERLVSVTGGKLISSDSPGLIGDSIEKLYLKG